MSEGLKHELQIAGGIFALAAVLGLWADLLPLALLVGALIYLSRHLYHLWYLIQHIKGINRLSPPHPDGLWREVYQRFESLHRHAQKSQRRHKRFMTRFRQATAEIPEALVILNINQNIEWANQSANRLFGINWRESRDKPFSKVINYMLFQEYFEAADFSRPLEFSPPNNRTQVVSLRVTPFGSKKMAQFLLLATDITQLYHMNQIRRDFVANVSHELRTPLSVIIGAVENLQHADKLPFQERPLMLMQKQAARMQSLTEDLIILSRIEMQSDAPEQEIVAIPSMLQEILDDGCALSGDNAHVIKQEIEPDLWLLGNEKELRSAFSNLIFNAIKHTPQRANVTVSWKSEASGPVFSVQDSGEGIAARQISRLTERFYRVDVSRSRNSGGTGLGLAIVKHAIHRHGGELQISSKIGMGSTFVCRFPHERTYYDPQRLSHEQS